METKHIDYFLRRILISDANKPFVTLNEEFNTLSKSLNEFVRQDKDCYKGGSFITYVFGKENKILGLARMKPLSFIEFKEEI